MRDVSVDFFEVVIESFQFQVILIIGKFIVDDLLSFFGELEGFFASFFLFFLYDSLREIRVSSISFQGSFIIKYARAVG